MQDAQAINFSWLLRLRWGAIVGQATIILIVDRLMDIALPLRWLFVILAVETASNVAFQLWARRALTVAEGVLGGVMGLDIVLLTALLHFTGGPFNPFSFLYLVHIALAAVILRPVWTWSLFVFSFVCFGALFLDHVWLPAGGGAMDAHVHDVRMHLEGMWVAFGVAAGFIIYFVQRVTRALAGREAELAAARSLTARNEKLASLATLAAGAAHQLSTPLSTIAVVAKELERQLEREPGPAEAVGDVRLIREQVERCRDILLQMAADAGESTGEPIVPVTIEELLDAAMKGIADRERTQVVIAPPARGRTIVTAMRSVAQAVRAVVKNALEASDGTDDVTLGVAVDDRHWRIEVRDAGPGMAADVLQHAGEPFFTTKGPDRGMGLGLFLTRVVLERLGGRLEIRSVPARGTTAVLILPVGAPSSLTALAPQGRA
jgi:two-component system sensor histidine kinase RegB